MEKGRQRQVRALHHLLVTHWSLMGAPRDVSPRYPFPRRWYCLFELSRPFRTEFSLLFYAIRLLLLYFSTLLLLPFIAFAVTVFILLLWLLLLTRCLASFDCYYFILSLRLLRLLWFHFIRSYIRNLKRISFIELAVRIKTRNSLAPAKIMLRRISGNVILRNLKRFSCRLVSKGVRVCYFFIFVRNV